jgi:hypothetical protein
MSENFKIKTFSIIEVKYKTKYKKFITTTHLLTEANYISFKGVEIDNNEDLNDINKLMDIMQESLEKGEYIERYFPWSSIVEVQIKRYKQ